ncbi:hypothetical protein RclHR1_09010002 [Rhizophagus clarus]|uniref:Uncharacterized protein n=1 Tax=Rhizophagus clarus TaxID=94130 RepID=A0A2Z6SPK4_9GLOM|nr:hypothetical protein RclHR1_09010002 [Rhizophagus clarus]GES73938.1 hypothetical protein GLOIN_2v1786931 [Rhizophagus clarus]
MLNKKIYGIDIDINNLERKESLSKLDLELELFSSRLAQRHISNRGIRMDSDRNLNSSYGYNTTTDTSQTNFDNSFPRQNVVEYTLIMSLIRDKQVNFNNIPQHIPEGSCCNGSTNSFCGNVGNNVMTIQAVLITDNQNNDFSRRSINSFSTSTSTASQNGVAYHVTNSQQIDF